MSGKKKYYVLTKTAELDFRKAKQWSLSRWGKELTQQYFHDVHNAAERVAQGYTANRIEQINELDLAIHAVREHYLVYMPTETEHIIIVAFIRQTRDLVKILREHHYVIKRELRSLTKLS